MDINPTEESPSIYYWKHTFSGPAPVRTDIMSPRSVEDTKIPDDPEMVKFNETTEDSVRREGTLPDAPSFGDVEFSCYAAAAAAVFDIPLLFIATTRS